MTYLSNIKIHEGSQGGGKSGRAGGRHRLQKRRKELRAAAERQRSPRRPSRRVAAAPMAAPKDTHEDHHTSAENVDESNHDPHFLLIVSLPEQEIKTLEKDEEEFFLNAGQAVSVRFRE